MPNGPLRHLPALSADSVDDNARAKGARAFFHEFWNTGDEALLKRAEKINAWLRYREAVRELSQFSDQELCDIGIRRSDIEDIVRRTGPRKADA
jgi:uncharacterized protein YjiS (DUF1127 family)